MANNALFERLRPSRFSPENDPNGGLAQNMPGIGNISPQGFLDDDSVTSDTIRTDAVIARHIQADAVEAGKIAADSITAREIVAGSITADEIAANTITANEIAANAITASEIAANAVTADEIAANTITANEIAASAITANELAANSVITSKILAGNVTSSRIELTISGKNFGANSGSTGAPGIYFDSSSSTGLHYAGSLPFFGTTLGVSAGGSRRLWVSSLFIGTSASVMPGSDNAYSLGGSSNRWADVWAVDGTINTSDARQKRDIADGTLGLDFVRRVPARVYRWRDTVDTQARVNVDGKALARELQPHERRIENIRRQQTAGRISDEKANAEVDRIRAEIEAIRDRHERPAIESREKRRPGKRRHYGFIAQEVKAALDDVGVDPMDAAFWSTDENGTQSLRYTELISVLWRAVQELSERVYALEGR